MNPVAYGNWRYVAIGCLYEVLLRCMPSMPYDSSSVSISIHTRLPNCALFQFESHTQWYIIPNLAGHGSC